MHFRGKNLITGLLVPQLRCGRVFLTSTPPCWSWVLAAEAVCAGLHKQIKQRNSKARVTSGVGGFSVLKALEFCLVFILFGFFSISLRKAFHIQWSSKQFVWNHCWVARTLWAVVSLICSASLSRWRIKCFIYPVRYLSSNQLLFLLHSACIIARVSGFM